MLFGERFCRIKLLFKILSLVSVAKEKFPNFAVEGFKSNEICDATKDLPERYKKHSKHLPSTQKCHHISKVVGYFLTKTCPCHHQIEQNQEKKKRCCCPNCRYRRKHFLYRGQFYKVRYSFIYGKGGEVVQLFPAMCSKNNLEEHLLTFLKYIRQSHDFLNDSDQA